MKTISINVPTRLEEVEFDQVSEMNVRACFGNYDGYGIDKESAFCDLVNNMPIGHKEEAYQFPNGFVSWYETHYFVCLYIGEKADKKCTLANQRSLKQGVGGLWELSQELTDEFESLNQGREWDGEWMEELEAWLEAKDKDR